MSEFLSSIGKIPELLTKPSKVVDIYEDYKKTVNYFKKTPESLAPNSLPFTRNSHFTGREHIFQEICDGFDSGDTISLAQTITGMGGLGKTQTAVEYYYRYADRYNLYQWIQAETRSGVLAAYKQFAVKMNPLYEELSSESLIIEVVLEWMDSNDKWLFIYDNAEGIYWDTDWWPKNHKGNILVTTRNEHISIGKKVDISLFKEDEAIEFFEKRIGEVKDIENAKELAKRLGYLPLALEQAAAYMWIHRGLHMLNTYLSLISRVY